MRQEKIKTQHLPLFKALCKTTPSATLLFGDKLEEELKKIERTENHIDISTFLRAKNGHEQRSCQQQHLPPCAEATLHIQTTTPGQRQAVLQEQSTCSQTVSTCKAVSDAIINVSHLRVNNTKENFRAGKPANAIHEWE
ncbi:hypothetical protein DPMN_135237 [Dreissena polymorpha]|uniref:Uncharacterized protein n=1 Tax=Dreissena polymorpha TaxID=45954 RepID=A0A9D4G1G0_DREPO|nr:hypothetical protein DPMN_135237 [Dreissena polymorpha]